jgi:hypothetical protein
MCKPDMKLINKKDKSITIATFVSLGVSFIFVLLVLFWLIFPYKPLSINNHPYPVITKEVKKGDVLLFEVDYCKLTDKKATITRRFIDSLLYVMPDITAVNEMGCRRQLVSEEIPQNLPAGEYVMDFYYTYKVNPIREVTVHAHTQKFQVIERN